MVHYKVFMSKLRISQCELVLCSHLIKLYYLNYKENILQIFTFKRDA